MAKPSLSSNTEPRVPPCTRVLIGAVESAERSRLEAMLVCWGHRVDLADNGLALLTALRQGEPAPLLIIDNSLPGLNGVALVHELHLQSTRRRSWTIALTDAAESAGRDPASLSRGAGIDDFLVKPIEEFDLRVCLHTALRVRSVYAEMLDSIDSARFHATHDPLTGLWNRESLLSHLFQETERTRRTSSPFSFLLLDLDHFSYVNREHGYDGGDNALRQLASRFRRFLRSYDLIGRCGEDEFLIAMPGATNDDARGMALRLRDCISERPFDILKASIKITASFGIAQSEARSPLTVLREAESALSAAKLAGGDCVRFFVPNSALVLRPAPSPTHEFRQERDSILTVGAGR